MIQNIFISSYKQITLISSDIYFYANYIVSTYHSLEKKEHVCGKKLMKCWFLGKAELLTFNFQEYENMSYNYIYGLFKSILHVSKFLD